VREQVRLPTACVVSPCGLGGMSHGSLPRAARLLRIRSIEEEQSGWHSTALGELNRWSGLAATSEQIAGAAG